MSNFENPRMQALVGLSVTSFCTLAFHACAKSLTTSESVTAPPPAWPSTQNSHLEDSQFNTLVITLETLARSIAQVNSSIHSRIDHEFSLLQKQASCQKTPPPSMGPNDGIYILMSFIGMAWFFGMCVSCNGMYNISEKFMLKVLFTAVWCANLGLLVVVFFAEGMKCYVFILAAVWPVQVVMGLRVWLVSESEVGKMVGKVGEKEKEKLLMLEELEKLEKLKKMKTVNS
ncbi:uncharacterized protein LY89DRAFT_688438 [Mollisia scopiformis]|uniref:Uncharacterized protein n=1 Tax=Mollisia scopiformis TaxID=149040 RepID=A0A194WWA7_MOLSC|nr:uncharacterized protein LY89DRAFT_688438 [Mollisia scopiformis]KUJ11954.1 hypothetical protein LY89DRAFT_688438 [Mollisia scopiformis]